jgi:hypothetical protein
MATRSIRKTPFCWQEKEVLRLIKNKFNGIERVKMLCLYQGLTWIDNDFNEQNIKYYTKTIATYTGLSKDWIPQGLQKLEKLSVISIYEDKSKGRFSGKVVAFTPQKAGKIPQETVTGQSVIGQPINGQSVIGQSDTLEESNIQEQINLQEQSSLKEKDISIYCKNEFLQENNQTNEILNLFKSVNPSYQRLFSNITERKSLERLIDKYGKEKIINIVTKLPDIITQPFAPRITTPYQLEKKLGDLIIFIKQSSNKPNKLGVAII